MCDCKLAEILARAIRERDEALERERQGWTRAAERSKELEEMGLRLQELQDALRMAEAERDMLRSRLEERRPGGLVRYEADGIHQG